MVILPEFLQTMCEGRGPDQLSPLHRIAIAKKVNMAHPIPPRGEWDAGEKSFLR